MIGTLFCSARYPFGANAPLSKGGPRVVGSVLGDPILVSKRDSIIAEGKWIRQAEKKKDGICAKIALDLSKAIEGGRCDIALGFSHFFWNGPEGFLTLYSELVKSFSELVPIPPEIF